MPDTNIVHFKTISAYIVKSGYFYKGFCSKVKTIHESYKTYTFRKHTAEKEMQIWQG